jgi:UDP-N-acetylmuramyl pentapeptide phosphotransferase/UDP-N-acetylglucosamine-1-phosphate transferase
MDTGLSMLRRLLKSLHIMEVDQDKNVVKFFSSMAGYVQADRDHIHHRLIEMGFTQKSSHFLYVISFILGILAFLLSTSRISTMPFSSQPSA